MENIIILDLESAVHSVEIFNYMEDHQIKDILDFFEGDPDWIKIDDKKTAFCKIDIQQNQYVIYLDLYREFDKSKIENMLMQFFASDFKEHFLKKESDWSVFTDNCIAYRNREGTFYAIWEYKG